MNTPGILNFEISRQEMGRLAYASMQRVGNRETVVMSCANPHSLVTANQDHTFREALHDADYLIADGVGVTALQRVLYGQRCPRITGHDFFCAIHQALSVYGTQKLHRKGRVFFFGSSPQVLAKIQERFERDYPDLTLCGVLSPPYGEWPEAQNTQMIEQINAAQPDVLWVGMTAPKQEKWVYQNRKKLDVAIIGNIGAVFDFYAGTYPRAPQWACKLGIEWLVRLLKEPRRLWRRTLISAPLFLAQSLLHRFTSRTRTYPE